MVGNGVKYISNRDYLRTNPFKFDSNRPIGFRDDDFCRNLSKQI